MRKTIFALFLLGLIPVLSIAAKPATSEKACLAKASWDSCDTCCAGAKTNAFRTECKASCRTKFLDTEISERACLAKDGRLACESCCGKAKTNEFRTECLASCRNEFGGVGKAEADVPSGEEGSAE